MLILKETSLRDFEGWSGAKFLLDALTDEEKDQIEQYIDELYPNGIDETQLNDIFWFDGDFIAETLGYEDEESLLKSKNVV